jgi:hypothetical protein
LILPATTARKSFKSVEKSKKSQKIPEKIGGGVRREFCYEKA